VTGIQQLGSISNRQPFAVAAWFLQNGVAWIE
jgi:hypothetical protein